MDISVISPFVSSDVTGFSAISLRGAVSFSSGFTSASATGADSGAASSFSLTVSGFFNAGSAAAIAAGASLISGISGLWASGASTRAISGALSFAGAGGGGSRLLFRLVGGSPGYFDRFFRPLHGGRFFCRIRRNGLVTLNGGDFLVFRLVLRSGLVRRPVRSRFSPGSR